VAFMYFKGGKNTVRSMLTLGEHELRRKKGMHDISGRHKEATDGGRGICVLGKRSPPLLEKEQDSRASDRGKLVRESGCGARGGGRGKQPERQSPEGAKPTTPKTTNPNPHTKKKKKPQKNPKKKKTHKKKTKKKNTKKKKPTQKKKKKKKKNPKQKHNNKKPTRHSSRCAWRGEACGLTTASGRGGNRVWEC